MTRRRRRLLPSISDPKSRDRYGDQAMTASASAGERNAAIGIAGSAPTRVIAKETTRSRGRRQGWAQLVRRSGTQRSPRLWARRHASRRRPAGTERRQAMKGRELVLGEGIGRARMGAGRPCPADRPRASRPNRVLTGRRRLTGKRLTRADNESVPSHRCSGMVPRARRTSCCPRCRAGLECAPGAMKRDLGDGRPWRVSLSWVPRASRSDSR